MAPVLIAPLHADADESFPGQLAERRRLARRMCVGMRGRRLASSADLSGGHADVWEEAVAG